MKINKFENSLIFKVICFLLIFSVLPWNAFYPRTVKADKTGGHQSYFVETLIDDNGIYVAKVVNDSNNFGDGAEENRMKESATIDGNNNYIDWTQYSANSLGSDDQVNPFKYGIELGLSEKGKEPLDDDSGLIFSFPSYQRKNGDSYLKDQDRAISVSKELTSSLNTLVSNVKSNINYNSSILQKDDGSSASISEKISDTIYISRLANPEIDGTGTDAEDFTKVSIGGALDVYYADATNYGNYISEGGKSQTGKITIGDETIEGVTTIDGNGNLLMYILAPKQVVKSAGDLKGCGLIWAMPKGYLSPVDGTAVKEELGNNMWGLANSNSADNKGDAVWLTVFTLAEYANAQAQIRDYTISDTSTEDTNFVESTIYGFFMNIYGGLLNLLQLSTIPELIYGQGIMSDSWWNVVLKYHLIFQIVAWMMLIVAVAKILIQVNFSTVNPTVRMSIMDTGQKLITVGFALALCVPFIRMLEELNRLIVNIFQSQAYDEGNMLRGFGIAGLVILFGYFGITFTMNCIYIMRAIMVALLTASAPLFITSMAFSGPKQKGLLDNWLKEISANIFMQSIHAFAFAFLFDVMGASNLMIRLVIYFSLLPIVDSFRQLVFGNAGGFAVSQGKAASQTVGAFMSQTAGGVAKGVGNAATSFAAGKMRIPLEESSGGDSTSGEQKSKDSGARLNQNVAKIGDHLVKNGNSRASRTMGHALKGATKAADLVKSSGGIMGNAVTQANLGNVGESVKASQTYGEGVSTNTERSMNDAGDTARHALESFSNNQSNRQAQYQNATNTANNNLSQANSQLIAASLTGNAGLVATAQNAVNTAQKAVNRNTRRANTAGRFANISSRAANVLNTTPTAKSDTSGNVNITGNADQFTIGPNGDYHMSDADYQSMDAVQRTSLNLNRATDYDATSNTWNLGNKAIVSPKTNRVTIVGVNKAAQQRQEAASQNAKQLQERQNSANLQNIANNLGTTSNTFNNGFIQQDANGNTVGRFKPANTN